MFAWVLTAAAAPLGVTDIPSPRSRGSWVADEAELLPPEAEARIDAQVEALKAELGVEIAVVTAPEVDGDAKDFATRLFNTWGVGGAQANNGVLFLVVTGSRRTEIEVGYGLETVLTDATTGRILDHAVVPRFKEGDMAGGIEGGVRGLADRIRSRPDESREGTGGVVDVDRAPSATPAGAGHDALLLGGGTGLGLAALGGSLWWSRRRARACPTCGKQMTQLDEYAEDTHLDAGQQSEESVGSVDWQVYVCAEHEQMTILDRARWFSGFHRCAGCGYRTGRRHRETLVAATYTNGGTVRVSDTCAHCTYTSSSTHHTAPIPRPSSSSSSGGGHRSGGSSGGGRSGGGFGGGRSGGGGAGRSW